ncbi:MAG: hypothetical protein P8Y25_05660 [Chromatiaceae bacterium]|jgi:hypothetical protein
MTTQPNPDLQQLAETVARLSDALAASERRQIAVARAVRWGALAFTVFVAALLYAGSDMIKAYASQITVTWDRYEHQLALQPPPLDKILMSLMGSEGMQGALVKVLQSSSMIAGEETQSFLECVKARSRLPEPEKRKKLCFSKTLTEDLGQFFLDDRGELPKPPAPNAGQDEQMAYGQRMMAGTLMAAGQTLVDAAALVHRLRRDSDLLRGTVNDIGGVRKTLEGIRQELWTMNVALRAVPAMAGEMGVMNKQMSVMSYSVGSTMGRMGNIMPW